METASTWNVTVLGGVVALGAIALYSAYRVWLRRDRMTPEERHELAATPMPKLQKRALLSTAIGLITLGVLSAILTTYGAAEYWDNDDLRLTVVAIFIAGLASHVGLLTAMVSPLWSEESELDERDRWVLATAPAVQTGLVLLTLAAWHTSLAMRFHDQGVPTVYLYLIFGTVVLVSLIGHSAGIVVGYWMGSRFGQS